VGVVRQGGAPRRRVAEDLAKEIGGSVESFHFAFGDVDAYVICDAPDNKTAARLARELKAVGIEVTEGVIEPVPYAIPDFVPETAGAEEYARGIARVAAPLGREQLRVLAQDIEKPAREHDEKCPQVELLGDAG
jgi:uncharacterized protein with GYD domain